MASVDVKCPTYGIDIDLAFERIVNRHSGSKALDLIASLLKIVTNRDQISLRYSVSFGRSIFYQ